jgi:hypothetical protein
METAMNPMDQYSANDDVDARLQADFDLLTELTRRAREEQYLQRGADVALDQVLADLFGSDDTLHRNVGDESDLRTH